MIILIYDHNYCKNKLLNILNQRTKIKRNNSIENHKLIKQMEN